ncbi:hypothetical protein SynBIOSE41_03024 [Synechococcus sp. BIOS-E4-1]|nr:hypothetical protein SynBIOSE41_03024 [Synechococcus sp. BIOS-E4-1]
MEWLERPIFPCHHQHTVLRSWCLASIPGDSAQAMAAAADSAAAQTAGSRHGRCT